MGAGSIMPPRCWYGSAGYAFDNIDAFNNDPILFGKHPQYHTETLSYRINIYPVTLLHVYFNGHWLQPPSQANYNFGARDRIS